MVLRVLAEPAHRSRDANEHQHLLYTAVERAGHVVGEHDLRALLTDRWDVWHLHWPDLRIKRGHGPRAWLRLLRFQAELTAARARGTRIVWTVHNLRPHDRRTPAHAALLGLLTRQVDATIHLSGAGRELALAAHPPLRRRPAAVIPRGDYRGRFGTVADVATARARLSLPPDATVLAFVGKVRPYKGVPRLIEAFAPLAARGVVLLVAGEPHTPEVRAELERLAASAPGVHARLRFLTAEELQWCIRASDLVTLPYREVLNSGAALAALSLDRPVLLPDQPVFREVREKVGADWVRLYAGPLTTDALRDAVAWLQRRGPEGPARWPHSWDDVAAETVELYRRVVADRPRRRPRRRPRHRSRRRATTSPSRA